MGVHTLTLTQTHRQCFPVSASGVGCERPGRAVLDLLIPHASYSGGNQDNAVFHGEVTFHRRVMVCKSSYEDLLLQVQGCHCVNRDISALMLEHEEYAEVALPAVFSGWVGSLCGLVLPVLFGKSQQTRAVPQTFRDELVLSHYLVFQSAVCVVWISDLSVLC